MDTIWKCMVVFLLAFWIWYPLGKYIQDRRWREGWGHKNIKESNENL